MNIDDIKARLRELNAVKYLNDDETDEREELLDTLAMLRGEQRKKEQKDKKTVDPEKESTKREHTVVGKTIAKGLKAVVEHFKEKPVTLEELHALKMKAVKERLKADIAKSKKVQRDSKGDLFGSSSNTNRKRPKNSSKTDSLDDMSKVLRGAVKSNKDLNFFSSHSSNDIRRTLGI